MTNRPNVKSLFCQEVVVDQNETQMSPSAPETQQTATLYNIVRL